MESMQSLRTYNGPMIPYYFLFLYNIPCTWRSFVHMCYKDGGVNCIAGMPLTNDVSTKNLIAAMAQWGSSQCVLAFIIWVVLFRYPELTPLMLTACLLELILRLICAQSKSFHTSHTPPGAIGTKVFLPIVFVMCVWSFYGSD